MGAAVTRLSHDDDSPFTADDPMLPARDAPIGYCGICGHEHRLDERAAEVESVRESRAARRMLGLVGLFVVGAVVGLVYGLTR